MNTRCVSPVRAPSLNAGASAARMRLSRDPPEQLSQESVVFSGLNHPSAVRFASDGRVFVAEKNGLIEVFDNLSDSTPTVFADLRTNVHDFWDRGLLGMALDPNFPTSPYVYVLYTYDAPPGRTAPVWNDNCSSPPGATTDRLRRHGSVAVATASATTGTVPLTVRFDGSQSRDPDGDPLTYSWDLNGDGVYGDSTAVAPTYTYTKPGRVTVRLRVTDSKGASAVATLSIQPKKK